MPVLPALPEELLGLIFSHLHNPEISFDEDIGLRAIPRQVDRECQQTLASLCLVSKQCCRLARPLLYHTIHIFDAFSLEGSHCLDGLVRTLVYQPMFTRYIVKLCIDGIYLDDGGGDDEESWDLPFEDAVDASRAFDQDSESRQYLMHELRRGNVSAHSALLLAMCKDVKSLHVAFAAPFWASSDFVRQVFLNAGCGSDPSVESKSLAMSSLKELSMQATKEYTIAFSEVLNLLQLPKLQVFRGHGILCDAEDIEYDIVTSNVTSMHLDHCLIDAEGVRSVLQSCPQLQDFTLVWGEYLMKDNNIKFNDIGRSLGRYGRNLRTLSLEADRVDIGFNDAGGLGDLSQMTSLEVVNLPAEVLVGVRMRTVFTLPTTLKWLHLDITTISQDEDFWQQMRVAVEHGKPHSLLSIKYCDRMNGPESMSFWDKSTGYSR